MFVGGEFVNTNIVNSKKETMEFEKYCKDEGISSIHLRREICKSCSIKRKEFIKSILGLIKKIMKYRRNRILS